MRAKSEGAASPVVPAAALPLDRMQEFFIPVHGFVYLYPEEVAILSHPAFQRLRRVRQLGFAHMVFPGAVHTRFEHSIGAVHVAQRILNSLSRNYSRANPSTSSNEEYRLASLSPYIEMFARLGALLHDIGHVPFGHTLEDELQHIDKHDGPDRVERICKRAYPKYKLDTSLVLPVTDPPEGGWSLASLVNALYKPYLDPNIYPRVLEPFTVITMIISKPPNEDDPLRLSEWDRVQKVINRILPLNACRDVVGNTICADFLDYLYRDLHHLGKPHNEDRRLYQYMEIRAPHFGSNTFGGEAPVPESGLEGKSDDFSQYQFVINVGFSQRHRHDALTNILQMLDLRYQLAETVLFHRTKLSMTALLDRCLIEVRRLFEGCELKGAAKGWEAYLREQLLEAMLAGSDDALTDILNQFAEGGNEGSARKRLRSALKAQEAQLEARGGLRHQESLLDDDSGQDSGAAGPGLQNQERKGEPQEIPSGAGSRSSNAERAAPADMDIGTQTQLIKHLSECLRDRTVFTLAQRVGIAQLGPVPETEKHEAYEVSRVIEWYARPENRRLYIDAVERMCRLPAGSLIIYVPPSSRMNAKIADVKLYIDGRIQTLWEYETQMPSASLTAGALRAQVRRFFYLWNAQFFVERSLWHTMAPGTQEALRSVLERMFYLPPGRDAVTVRRETEVSVRAVRDAEELRAARGGELEAELAGFGDKKIMKRIPIVCP